MPTRKLTNLAYRCRIRIPCGVPHLSRGAKLEVSGTVLHHPDAYLRLLRRHHVLGSAALLRSDAGRAIILCSSENPAHSVSVESQFRVASITKMATALCALILAERGLLSLDQPVLTYFPGSPELNPLRGVTLAHLLSHTSGLTDPPDLERSLLEGVPFPKLLEGYPVAEPGLFRYSNLGFGLIGCLFEAVCQLPVSDVLRTYVFDPLGMRATLDASTLSPDLIVPITRIYRRRTPDLIKTPLGKIPLSRPDPLRHYGHTAGAMYLDLESLEKLMDCLMRKGRPLLSGDLGEEMTKQHAAYGKISPTLSYGFGMLRISDRAISPSLILGHQGFAYGCADGAFWENETGRLVLFLNGGASEARRGRLGLCNYDILRFALRKEMPEWSR